MMQVAKQFLRVFSDDGRGDKDFSVQEERLREVTEKLFRASDLLRQASATLTDLIKARSVH